VELFPLFFCIWYKPHTYNIIRRKGVVLMQLLSIATINPIEGFEDRLELEFDMLQEDGLDIALKREDRGDAFYFYCYIDDEILLQDNYYYEQKNMFLSCVANALSDIIINHWEPKLMKKIIGDNYFYFDKVEQERIYDFARDILSIDDINGKLGLFYQIKRKTFVLNKIHEYLKDNNTIVLDGFVNFRLKEYLEQLEETVDKAVDEYLIDKEYQEFIKLLRHFVDLQETKRDLVNIFVRNDKLFLLDENLKIIRNDEAFDNIARDNPDINVDDILVSTLINIAPKKIVIHGFTGKEKKEVISALYNIFEGRVSFCSQCETCLKTEPLKTK